jgi:hypothetical protein
MALEGPLWYRVRVRDGTRRLRASRARVVTPDPMNESPLYPRLPAREQGELLRGIVARCRRLADGSHGPAPRPVVVFDLDGTLMDNRPRSRAILHEIAGRWQTREPAIAARLLAAESSELRYHFRDSLERLGVTREDLVEEAFTFWKERFFSDEPLRHDVQVSGASAFARSCYDAGATLVYLTGRDLPLMGMGTFASLRDLGFPIGVPGTELVLKPDAAMPDTEFKRFEAPKLSRVGKVVAAFDNEPENCNILLAQFPDAASVFLDTQHLAGAPPLDPGVRVIGDFELGP